MIPQTKEVFDNFHSAIKECQDALEMPNAFIYMDSWTGNLMGSKELYEDESKRGVIERAFASFGFKVEFSKRRNSEACVIYCDWIGRPCQ